MQECSLNYANFIFYTNILAYARILKNYFDDLKFVEKSLLKTAKNLCYYTVVKQFERVYERTGKYVKIIDFENKKYVFEELDETPVFTV